MIIRNGNIVTWTEPNQILEGHEILIQDGLIKAIEPEPVLSQLHPEEEVLDAQGQLIMPGNICAHTHFYGAFSADCNQRSTQYLYKFASCVGN